MPLQPDRAPLFEKLVEHRKNSNSSFHVPGHKSGQGLAPIAREWLQQVMYIDYTEITGLDDLHHPEGVIEEAQTLAAGCYGAEATFFLVGGSTAGNQAMLLTVCEPGDLILVQRNVHKSVLHGLMLAGARAVFLPPKWDPITGQSVGVHLTDVEMALMLYPEAKGLLLTNPNYFGMGIDLKPFAELLHSNGKLLLVDEAHGAHYGFHPDLPQSALSAGADAVVQSTHKMLTAMTMGAMLHIQGNRISTGMLKQRLSMIQSSSPSYPILASLDLARMQMHTMGEALLEQGLAAAKHFKEGVQALGAFQLLSEELPEHCESYDPFKVAVRDLQGLLSGDALRNELEKHGCFVEMADPHYVLLLFSLASTIEDADRAIRAFSFIIDQFGLKKQENQRMIANTRSIPSFLEMSAPVTFHLKQIPPGQVQSLPLQEAVNRTAAEMVIPYPPGIPVLYPGEFITQETVSYLTELSQTGARFQGASDSRLEKVLVWTSNQ